MRVPNGVPKKGKVCDENENDEVFDTSRITVKFAIFAREFVSAVRWWFRRVQVRHTQSP